GDQLPDPRPKRGPLADRRGKLKAFGDGAEGAARHQRRIVPSPGKLPGPAAFGTQARLERGRMQRGDLAQALKAKEGKAALGLAAHRQVINGTRGEKPLYLMPQHDPGAASRCVPCGDAGHELVGTGAGPDVKEALCR